jgi:nucleotide-binding universal stress UspA family protein
MQQIVVGVDGSDGSRLALRWAAEEARLRSAKLIAVIAWHVSSFWLGLAESGMAPSPADVALDEQAAEREASSRLQRIVAEVLGDDPDIPIETKVLEGAAAPVLISQAREADLLVVGTRGLGGFRGLLLGSVSQHLSHHAPCPLVIVPAQKSEGLDDQTHHEEHGDA